ncbi:MAG TPA: hypothetical protein VKZ49_12940 [Polyangiaceae bacterium]|nr:hypothetical protein [Polyangiaceae bacterium]
MHDPAQGAPELSVPDQERTAGRSLEIRVVLVTVVAVASIVWTKLSLPAAFLTFIAFLSVPSDAGRRGRLLRRWLLVAAVAASVGVVRFITGEAIDGIVQGGKTATSSRALSRLREIITLQDARRTHAVADHDGDGIGSAALISELVEGSSSQGFGRVPRMEVKGGQLIDTPVGPALSSGGYLFLTCLPSVGGPFVARAEPGIDPERAEREFLVYAWPAHARVGASSVFFGDQHERLLVLETDPPAYLGPERPPDCHAALDRPERWKAWRDKQPRSELPGDHSDAKGGS